MKATKMRKQLELGKVTITTIGRQEQTEVKGGTSIATINPLNYDCNQSEAPVKCPPGYYTVDVTCMC